MIEFWTSDDGGEIMLQENGNFRLLTANDPIVEQIFLHIKEDYPKSYAALLSIYGKKENHKFRMVSRFIRCNFSRHDSIPDLDITEMHMEVVRCPLRGECQYEKVICHPEYNTSLSDREMEILRLIAQGKEESEIADALFLSFHTVKNHRNKIYKKIKVSNKAEAVLYCKNHNIC